MPDPWIRIGSIRSVNPARRELRVAVGPRDAASFDGLEWIHVALGDDTVLRCRVAGVKPHGAAWIVALAPGVTRDAVARMKGAGIVVARHAPGARSEGSLRGAAWVGMEVVGVDGQIVGTVADVIETGANDVLEIEKPGGASILLPLIERVVERIEQAAGRLVVGEIAPYAVDDED